MTETGLKTLKKTNDLSRKESRGGKMPVLFVGHGSPMNAIEENAYTRALIALGE